MVAAICLLVYTESDTAINELDMSIKNCDGTTPCLLTCLGLIAYTCFCKPSPAFTLSSLAVWWQEGQVMGEEVFSDQSVFPRCLRLLEKRPALGDTRGPRPSPRVADQRQKGLFRNQIQRA